MKWSNKFHILYFAICVTKPTEVVRAAGENDVFFSKDPSVSGDLTQDAVTDVDNCWATGSEPQAFTSQAPQFCLTVSSTG